MVDNSDDFWNESSSSAANFFDEDEETSQGEVFQTLPQTEHLPIHAIIANKSLIAILDDISTTLAYAVIPPEETIKRLFLGLQIEIGIYKTLQDKLALLDFAVDIGDGYVITKVLIFMRKTLKKNIFLMQLMGRKVASKHYINLLIKENNLSELADFYMATGTISSLRNIYYLINKESGSASFLHKKLTQFSIDHGSNLPADDRLEIRDNVTFIEFKVKHNLSSMSIIDLLTQICKTEWEKGHSDDLLMSIKTTFKIDDFQYEWTLLSMMCQMQLWDRIQGCFIKSGWMMKKRTLKSSIRSDLFVCTLARHQPPKNILEQYLPLIGDSERSLWLADKYQIHTYVVSNFIEQKDRAALLKYMEKLSADDEAMEKIHIAINNPDIRWKN